MYAKRLKCVGNDLDIWGMAYNCWKWFTQEENGFSMWEMVYICGNWLRYVENDLSIWELG